MKKSGSTSGNPFGRLLRGLRLERKLTLEQVARKIGSHKGYCSGIESGKVNPPSAKIVDKFARLFDLDGADLLELAVVCKSPRSIRERLLARIESNKYLRAKIETFQTAPIRVTFGEPWPPGKISGAVPRTSLPSERGNLERTVGR